MREGVDEADIIEGLRSRIRPTHHLGDTRLRGGTSDRPFRSRMHQPRRPSRRDVYLRISSKDEERKQRLTGRLDLFPSIDVLVSTSVTSFITLGRKRTMFHAFRCKSRAAGQVWQGARRVDSLYSSVAPQKTYDQTCLLRMTFAARCE